MKKNILLSAFCSLLLFISILSCKKDTAVVDTGNIRYTNLSNGGNRYEIFLDGQSLGLINAGYSVDKASIPAGSHIVKASQYEGYILYPTVVEKTVNITKGITLQFQFP